MAETDFYTYHIRKERERERFQVAVKSNDNCFSAFNAYVNVVKHENGI